MGRQSNSRNWRNRRLVAPVSLVVSPDLRFRRIDKPDGRILMMRMTNYSDRELEQMLADLESDLVERKESFQGDAPTRIREAVCAFANDLANHRRAGVVFVGAKDDGQPANLSVTDELLRGIAE